MAEYARNVLDHYNLQNPYPVEWPPELDDTDEEEELKKNPSFRRSKSRYSALERSASDRKSLVPGSQKTGDGRANLVQKDEPDPLGGRDSVINNLRKRGLPVEDNTKLRNKFLLSSTTFSPALFLSQTHSDASTQSLLQGLDYLSRSIDQKSASLKVLVESNFDRFVRAKATIDNVYSQMRNQGAQADADGLRIHSRQTSRSSGHFRNFSGQGAQKAMPAKNSLTKESEYGVQGIKLPLLEATQKAEDVWGPALGGKERENGLKAVMEAVNKDRALYEIGPNIGKAIKQKDYDSIVEQYNLARGSSSDAKDVAERAIGSRKPLTDEQVHRILATGRMWLEVEGQIQQFKVDTWKRLMELPSVVPSPGVNQAEEHMELISVLLELGCDDNPIWIWLCTKYEHLRNKIVRIAEVTRVATEIARRHLGNGEKPSPQTSAFHLRSAGKEGPKSTMDSERIIEFWETLHGSLASLLSMSSGVLGEVVEFWESAQSFIDGHKQKSLPVGFEGQSRKHHRLSNDGVKHLEKGARELVGLLRNNVFSLFADPPVEDVSAFFSPEPPNTPRTPGSAALSPSEARFKIDKNDIPPPSPRRGEPWEEFAFWPPHANALSSVHYLGKFLVMIGTGASELASLGPVDSAEHENLRSLVGGTRERCVRSICAAWANDSEICKNLEDWTRSVDKRDQTKMPMHFMNFSSSVLTGMQKVLYISEALTKAGSADVVPPPPAKLLQLVRTQFVTSIYKALSGMVENAEKPIKTDEDDWIVVTEAMANANLDAPTSTLAADSIDASSRNVRMLLTLSNLKALRIDLVPQLITLFESSFSVKLTEESKTIRDVLGQIDARLFQSYTRPTIANLSGTVKAGITAPDWVPNTERPNQVRPYVYTTMLSLVLVHTEVSTTTSAATALTSEVLSYLLEAVSQALLDAFKERPKYSLPALMQATLDTEFIAQTMSQYSTDKASQIQSQIYLELDRRTNHEARAKLQSELGEMRVVLKKLREGTRSEFACFKRVRERGRAPV